METISTTLRKATTVDLSAINEIIEAAILSWDLPERVKRLSSPSYYYKPHDFEALEIVVAENNAHQIVGVAAWEPANPKDAPQGQHALLLHGIYVMPKYYRSGIGHQLFKVAEQAALVKAYSGLLVKAQADAASFFLAQGMQPLKIENENRDYAHRYWKLLNDKGEKK
ncbi:GNAT family N-acetyltransferase [Kaarinaea lacus]